MDNGSLLRYAGAVSASASYGLPTLMGVRVSRHTLVMLGFAAVVFALYAAGLIDTHGLAFGVIGAGPTSLAIGEDLAKDRASLKALFDAHKKADGTLEMPAEKIAEANKLNDAITEKAKAYEEQLGIEQLADANDSALKAMKRPDPRAIPADEVADASKATPHAKTLGELFVEGAYKAWIEAGRPKDGPAVEIDLAKHYGKAVASRGIKAVLNTTGFAPESVRLPRIVEGALETPRVADLMPQGRTTQAAIKYMEETTTTNAAAETAESGSKPESTIAFTERTSNVRKIATSLPVTDELLEDVAGIETYVDTRLRTFVALREDGQLLTGDGNAPNLTGILNTANILTQAKGADPTPDAVYKAMTKIRTTAFLEPTGAVFHPNDWQDIRLLRTADGIYIWGSPADPGPERIWGLQVVQTTSLTENTGLVGAFRDGAMIFRRSDVALQVGWVNDQFVKNQRTILAEERLALVVFRPTGFCTVTGI